MAPHQASARPARSELHVVNADGSHQVDLTRKPIARAELRRFTDADLAPDEREAASGGQAPFFFFCCCFIPAGRASLNLRTCARNATPPPVNAARGPNVRAARSRAACYGVTVQVAA